MSIIGKAISWFFGGTSSGDVIKAVDKLHLSDEEKANMDAADLASAREFLSGMAGPGFFNQLVDAFNRLIRPGVTFYLFGGWVGWWVFPSIEAMPSFWQSVSLLVLTFWFGGRVFLKDAPALLASLAKLKGSK